MAPRQMKMPVKDDTDKEAEEVFSQRKRPESGQYWLQVDRQTKSSYKTSEAARSAGLEIKTGYPIVQMSIYDSVDRWRASSSYRPLHREEVEACFSDNPRRASVRPLAIFLRLRTANGTPQSHWAATGPDADVEAQRADESNSGQEKQETRLAAASPR